VETGNAALNRDIALTLYVAASPNREWRYTSERDSFSPAGRGFEGVASGCALGLSSGDRNCACQEVGLAPADPGEADDHLAASCAEDILRVALVVTNVAYSHCLTLPFGEFRIGVSLIPLIDGAVVTIQARGVTQVCRTGVKSWVLAIDFWRGWKAENRGDCAPPLHPHRANGRLAHAAPLSSAALEHFNTQTSTLQDAAVSKAA